MLRVTAKDLKGFVSMPPTPCKPGAGGWDNPDSVDLPQSEKMFNLLVGSGVKVFALCGTTGENAALLFDEKRNYVDTAVKTVKKRSIIFAGATALGTKEVVRQMRAIRDLGAEGCFVGLPLWQTPTLKSSVQFYSDLSQAVPEMGIMVYSNQMFFKSDFTVDFWEGIGRSAPTVVTDKITHGTSHIADDIRVTHGQVNFVPGSLGILEADKKAPGKFNTCWSTIYGPEPFVAFIDAFNRGDKKRADEIAADIRTVTSSNRKPGPKAAEGYGEFSSRMLSEMAMYNAQVHKVEWNASGYLPGGVGPFRAPYTDFPEHLTKEEEEHGKHWMKLREKYVKVAAN